MNRKFSPRLTRAIVACFYGQKIYDPTWYRWKQWAKNLGTTGSFEQLSALVAIALLRRAEIERGETRFLELKLSAIRDLAQDVELQAQLAGLVEFIDQQIVVGREAPIALRIHYGISTSKRSLYRKVPKFHADRLYEPAYLRSFF